MEANDDPHRGSFNLRTCKMGNCVFARACLGIFGKGKSLLSLQVIPIGKHWVSLNVFRPKYCRYFMTSTAAVISFVFYVFGVQWNQHKCIFWRLFFRICDVINLTVTWVSDSVNTSTLHVLTFFFFWRSMSEDEDCISSRKVVCHI